jgi:type I restriction enzyme M protein
VEHAGDAEFSLLTRSSDGQMLFLANLVSKMKRNTKLGSRIAEVHNGSSLFTGDAGQGESNIRRWIIENDWLEAIVALPLNMFYNTGIATYVWVLTNRKPAHRQGKVQLIDATQWYRPLRKNMGKKNCELADDDIRRILDIFKDFEQSEQSKIFPNQAFGYWKVTVERPLRLTVDLGEAARRRLRLAAEDDDDLIAALDRLAARLGPGPHGDYNAVLMMMANDPDAPKLTAKRAKLLQSALTTSDEAAASVIKKVHRGKDVHADPMHGLFAVEMDGKEVVVEYEADTSLRDTEQVPLLEEGGIAAFMQREVLPHVPDAWVDKSKTQIGYEISFTRYFYKPQPLRSLEEIQADILALEAETEGLLEEIVGE